MIIYFVYSILLIVFDQSIKLLIAHYFTNENRVLLANILFLHPVQNKNLNWIASILDYDTPIIFMIIIQMVGIVIMLLSHRYLTYLWSQGRKLIDCMLIFFLSGILCSFIDVVFWGGSLDFLLLFDWFIFDLKDVYLDIGLVFLMIYILSYYSKSYTRMNKRERKETSIIKWFKKGMPSSNVV